MTSRRAGFPYWLLAAAVLAYFNALLAGFQFDDFNIIVDNSAAHTLAAWWHGMPGIRPLLKLSYVLNWLADPGPAGFHAVNVVLHLCNIVLVWRLTGHFPVPAGWAGEQSQRRARILATLLFALQPIQTESVTYISGRSMSLMAVFGLGGLLCWLEAPAKLRPRLWRALALALFAAAILSKEVAVALPLTLLLFRRHGRLAPLVFAALALAALFMLFGYQRLLSEPMPRTLAANLLSEVNAVYYLLGQLFQPQALNIDPELPELSSWSLLSLVQIAGLTVVAGLAWLARKTRPWFGFAVGWLIVLLLPTHSLIPRLDLASERHLYLAALGPFWLVAIAGSALLDGRWRWRGVMLALTLTGMTYTYLRNLDYRDEISLWRQTVTVDADNTRAWNNLGWAYLLANRRAEARQAFERTLQLEPGHAKARRNLRYLDEVNR